MELGAHVRIACRLAVLQRVNTVSILLFLSTGVARCSHSLLFGHMYACGFVCVFVCAQDVARHRADAKSNASPTRALDRQGRTGRFRKVEWSDVRVGDLLLVKNRESIPADMLVRTGGGRHQANVECTTW